MRPLPHGGSRDRCNNQRTLIWCPWHCYRPGPHAGRLSRPRTVYPQREWRMRSCPGSLTVTRGGKRCSRTCNVLVESPTMRRDSGTAHRSTGVDFSILLSGIQFYIPLSPALHTLSLSVFLSCPLTPNIYVVHLCVKYLNIRGSIAYFHLYRPRSLDPKAYETEQIRSIVPR